MSASTPAPRQSGEFGVWLVALGQTLGYVTQTFSFAALIVALMDPATGVGLSRTVLAAGPTLGLLLAAIAAPHMGRFIDWGFGARLLALGPLSSACGLLVAAQCAGHATLWIAGFLCVGMGQATSQFETCFAFLTRGLGRDARRAIVRVTLVAGFSTTLAFPLGDMLARHMGWSGALMVLAAVQVLVTCPLNIVGARLVMMGRRVEATPPGKRLADSRRVGQVLRTGPFWQLAGLLGLIWMNHAVLTTFALPVLMDRGATHDVAVMLASALGPTQVAGRLMLVLAGDNLPLRALTMWVLAGFVVAATVLMVGTGIPTLWLLYALAQGASAGVASILRPLLAADVLGREGFGGIWGALSVAPLLAGAAAPVLGATLLQLGGAPLLIPVCLAMALGALALGWRLRPLIGTGGG